MAKLIKRFKPKYIKRLRDRPSGIAQTGAHATSHRQNPPDIHRLGWAPRPFPRTGMTGEPNSTLMGRFGDGSLAYYTDEDREEFEKQSGPPGKGGNYQKDMQRQYISRLKSRPMLGNGFGVVGEAEIRSVIQEIIAELKEGTAGKDAFNYELMRSQEGDDEEEDDEVDEQSVAANVAGYSLPLGMSNRKPGSPPPWDAYARAIGGTPLKVTGTRTLKVRKMNKSDKY